MISYDLWDVDTGNNLGHFGSEEEALERVRALLDAYGDAYAEELHLGAQDQDGRPIPSLSGAALARAARAAQPALRGA